MVKQAHLVVMSNVDLQQNLMNVVFVVVMVLQMVHVIVMVMLTLVVVVVKMLQQKDLTVMVIV